MMNLVCFLLSLIFVATAYAGPIKTETDGIEVGNGGFIVQCPRPDNQNGLEETTVFFDYYEYTQMHPEWRISQSFADVDYYKTALNILKNYQRIDKLSAESLMSSSSMWFILEQSQTVLSLLLKDEYYQPQNIVPAPLPYMNSDILKDCTTKQIISFAKQADGKFAYSIDPGHFSLLDTVNKAVAMIHEINYLEHIRAADKMPLYPHVIRQTQFIFSLPDLRGADPETILFWQSQNAQKRQAHRLEFAQYGKYKIRLRKPPQEMLNPIFSAHQYINAYWNPLYRLKVSNEQKITSAFVENVTITDAKTNLLIGIGGRTEFHSTGEIKASNLQFPILYKNTICADEVYFAENGDLKDCT